MFEKEQVCTGLRKSRYVNSNNALEKNIFSVDEKKCLCYSIQALKEELFFYARKF